MHHSMQNGRTTTGGFAQQKGAGCDSSNKKKTTLSHTNLCWLARGVLQQAHTPVEKPQIFQNVCMADAIKHHRPSLAGPVHVTLARCPHFLHTQIGRQGSNRRHQIHFMLVPFKANSQSF